MWSIPPALLIRSGVGQDPAAVAAARELHVPGSGAAADGRAGPGARGPSAALDLEGVRRQPWRLTGTTPEAAATRAWAWARTVQLAKARPDCQEQAQRVRGVLRGVWRASSLVECVNSVVRMQQARHRKLSQGLLDLKRLYWNLRRFRTGRRKDQTPYGLLGLRLPDVSFWELLKMTPDQLRQELSATGYAP